MSYGEIFVIAGNTRLQSIFFVRYKLYRNWLLGSIGVSVLDIPSQRFLQLHFAIPKLKYTSFRACNLQPRFHHEYTSAVRIPNLTIVCPQLKLILLLF